MPWFKKGPDDRTLVFDTFVAVTREAKLWVCWQGVSLSPTQAGILARVLANLNTLGRSESWCEASLHDAVEIDLERGTALRRCAPLNGKVPEHHEIVRLLCPDPASAFISEGFVDSSKRKPKRTAPPYDPDWHLCAETLWLHKQRWSDPPGSRWVSYVRPHDCFVIEPRPRLHRVENRPRIQVARYALDSRVLPLVTETLPVAEAARRALMSIYGCLTECEGTRGRSAIFSGKDEHGKPLVGHGHAYFLPADEDNDGRLDHLTVFARDGFADEEQRALDRLRELRTGRESEARHPLRLLLLGIGMADEYQCGPLRESKVWVSATPYVATRYAKTRGRHQIDLASPESRAAFLDGDIRAQLAAVHPDLAGKDASRVTIVPEWDDDRAFRIGERLRPLQFKRFRRKTSDDGGRRLAGAFRLIFPQIVSGPICLGHSAHFGLGLFAAAES